MYEDVYPTRANISKSDDQVRIERGASEEGDKRRLNNHLYLGWIFPEWIPKVVIPPREVIDEIKNARGRGFPVEAIKGKTWRQLEQEAQTTVERHCEIGRTVIGHIREAFVRTGIVLLDRNLTNIIVDQHGRVWEADLGAVYDVFEPTSVP